MNQYIRKIEIGKWLQKNICAGECPSADAITTCLRTKQNCLSLWSINCKEEITDAAIAIVANCQSIETIDILIFEENQLNREGISIKSTPGNSIYEAFNTKHFDICDLDYNSLGEVSNITVESLIKKNYVRYTKRELKELFRNAIKDQKIKKEMLNQNIIDSIDC